MSHKATSKLPVFVIFDLDNTLYDYQECDREGTSNLLAFLAREIQEDESTISKGLSTARIAVKARLGSTAASHSRIAYINEFVNEAHKPMPITRVALAERVYWESFFAKLNLRPGAKELILKLKELKIPTFLITDLTLSIQIEKLEKLGLNDAFDIVISSEEAGGDKVTGLPFQLLESYIGQSSDEYWCLGDQCWDFPTNFGPVHSDFALDEINCQHNHSVTDFNSIQELLQLACRNN
jgi:putative hydrolase of the HAD superfamily